MLFTSPWFLVLLAPWLALTLLLLWGRRRRVDIPFLNLWRGPVESPAPKRSFERPPIWLAAAIGAMLLAILGAAGPALRRGGGVGPSVTIIVDRGLTLSGEARYHALIDDAAVAMAQMMPPGAAQLIAVPGDAYRTDLSGWAAMAKAVPATATDTRESLRAAVHDRLTSTRGPILVLTGQSLGIDNPRVVRIAPATPPRNVAVQTVALRESPAPQLMLRLTNESLRAKVRVRVHSDGRPVKELEVDLPAAGDVRDYFIDLPAIGGTVSVQLLDTDDVPADDVFSLVRQRLWPVIEPRASVPAELQRMIRSYGRQRPPGGGSARVAIVTDREALPPNELGVALAMASGESQLVSASELTVSDHRVTQSVGTWPVASGAVDSPGDGWEPLARKEGRVLVAVRAQPARQVWVNFPAGAWSASPDFVIFWTNVFDFLGAGGEGFGHRPVGRLERDWRPLEGFSLPAGTPAGLWPGIYQIQDGEAVAVNAPPHETKWVPPEDWRSILAGLSPEPPQHGLALASSAALIALTLLLLGVCAWEHGRAGQK